LPSILYHIYHSPIPISFTLSTSLTHKILNYYQHHNQPYPPTSIFSPATNINLLLLKPLFLYFLSHLSLTYTNFIYIIHFIQTQTHSYYQYLYKPTRPTSISSPATNINLLLLKPLFIYSLSYLSLTYTKFIYIIHFIQTQTHSYYQCHYKPTRPTSISSPATNINLLLLKPLFLYSLSHLSLTYTNSIYKIHCNHTQYNNNCYYRTHYYSPTSIRSPATNINRNMLAPLYFYSLYHTLLTHINLFSEIYFNHTQSYNNCYYRIHYYSPSSIRSPSTTINRKLPAQLYFYSLYHPALTHINFINKIHFHQPQTHDAIS
jgi:hypothetical protein